MKEELKKGNHYSAFWKSGMQSSMGGGTMRVDPPPVPQFRTTPDKSSSPSSSSPPPPNLKPPLSTDNSVLSTPNSSLSCSCHGQPCRGLKAVDGKEAKTANSPLYDHVFETVPSQREVEDAISALLK